MAGGVDVLVLGVLGLTLGALVSRAGPHSAVLALVVAAAFVVVVDVALQRRSGKRAGQTLGKQLARLRVETRDGRTPGTVQLVAREVRYLSAVLMAFDIGGPFGVHDRVLRTRVVRAGSRRV